jgi:DNA-binding response OmpR family regulator
MARILLLDGDACLWNSVRDILEGEGYTVCRAHNDYEGLPCALTGFMALTRGTVLYIVVF